MSTKGSGNGLKRIPAHERVLAWGGAAGLVLAAAFAALPASADTLPPDTAPVASPSASPPSASPPSASPPSAGAEGPTAAGTGVSDSGLAAAVLRDLGLTPEEFNAAGELGKEAADAASALRDIPGYIGTRLQDRRIIVTGSGPELEGKVAELSRTLPALLLEVPAADPASHPAADPAVRQAPSVPASGTELAVSTRQLFDAYVRDVGPEGLQAVAYTGGGFVIRTGGANTAQAALQDSKAGTEASSIQAGNNDGGKMSAREFVAKYANVELDDGAKLVAEADVAGGQGYFADTGEICSTGFSAFDPAGLPAILTAGHCSADGTAREVDLEFPLWNRAGLLGIFGFSQFGGPGNSIFSWTDGNPSGPDNPGSIGTDVAVIESIRSSLDPVPASSTWGAPSESGPDVKVIGIAAPVEGQRVCRSGRSSAWSCGTIDEVGIYVVQGRSADPSDLRAFNGFLSFDVQSSGGDSGGPWLSGNYAVGIHSAGDVPDEFGNVRNFAVAATLGDAMAVLPGYQLELFLNKPVVTSPPSGGTLKTGQAVAGEVLAAPASAVAAGSTVRVTFAGQDPFEVPVDAAGAWTFTAPETAGPLRFTAETINGYSSSGTSNFEFPAPAAEPPVTQPAGPPAAEPPATEPAAPGPPEAPVPPLEPAAPPAAAPVLPLGGPTAVGGGAALAATGSNLANTGAAGIMTAAAFAAGALAVGGLLTVLGRRRKKQRPTTR